MDAPSVLCIACALLLRLLVALSPYSGAGTPPKYGDYEAQRHWMELTTNLPVVEWYQDGPHNDPKYWPLDYPPLSGYQSYLHGLLVRAFDPAAVALGTSRGYETHFSKQLMRWTVLLSDVLIFFPAAVLAARAFGAPGPAPRGARSGGAAAVSGRLFVLAAALLQPAAVLIDHGHFQYNCISLGLTALAATAIAARRDVLGSVLFSAALNHKQMALFYAPAFFAHLLGRCLQQRGAARKVLAVARLGAAVVATFVVCWSPWLTSLEAAGQVARRIFPVGRGLYEDYLSNWWCVSSVAVKWKGLVASQAALAPLCAALTLAAAAPSMAHQLARPSPRGLLLGMANSALAFYMFGYQVHEKSILLPLLPVTLLAASEPDAAVWGPVVGAFSMFPLLSRDGLAPAYAATLAAWLAVAPGLAPPRGGGAGAAPARWRGAAAAVAVAGALALHTASALLPPPAALPWLWDRALVSYGFVFVAAGMAYLNARQWALPAEEAGTAGGGKKGL
ncbi:dolichyl pyrophosphate Man9GlcNAc2 alpha-1 [Scenedesmus sp. PABB004]|nr:dolichyl pyrophosphate Man9GlcNAc2 alpha-1 [Scenedesmus sp. PABB004]